MNNFLKHPKINIIKLSSLRSWSNGLETPNENHRWEFSPSVAAADGVLLAARVIEKLI